MPLTDTQIDDWSADFASDDTNEPRDRDNIATMLDDQARLVQSVERAEAEDKMWVKPGLLVTKVSATSFSAPGDQRLTYLVGRRARAVTGSSTVTGGYLFGTISDSVFATGTTTVTVIWDPVVYDSFALVSRPTADSVGFAGVGARADFSVTDRVEFWNLTTGARKVRQISSINPTGPVVLTFASGDPWVGIDITDIAVMMVHSVGMANTLSDVHVGLITPDLFESGWAHSLLAGSFTIPFVGIGPYTVALPVALQDGSYIPQVQALGVTVGTLSSPQWVKPIITTRLATSFDVTMPTAITGGTGKFNYVIAR